MGSSTSHEEPAPAKPPCKLIGRDGNAFAVIGAARRALLAAGEPERSSEFVRRAMACKSYDHLLRLVMEYVEVD